MSQVVVARPAAQLQDGADGMEGRRMAMVCEKSLKEKVEASVTEQSIASSC